MRLKTLGSPKRITVAEPHVCDYCRKTIHPGEKCENFPILVRAYTEGENGEHIYGDYPYEWHSCDRCKKYVDEASNDSIYKYGRHGMDARAFCSYMLERHCDVAIDWWGMDAFLFGYTLPAPSDGHGWGDTIRPGDGEKVRR